MVYKYLLSGLWSHGVAQDKRLFI